MHSAVGGVRLAAPASAESPKILPRPRTIRPERTTSARKVAPTAVTLVPFSSPSSAPNVNQTRLSPVAVPNRGVSVPLVPMGRLVIPRTGLDQAMHDGIAQNVINAGPAHWPGTALPGGVGNLVIAGHRTTHSKPFFGNATLRNGDQIIVVSPTGWRFVYVVDKSFVVANTAMWIKDQGPGRRITMFTCHPIGSARQRLVVQGFLQATLPPG